MPRDGGVETATGTKSVRNSLTVMMHVMGVGTVADPAAARFLQTSDAIAAIATPNAGNVAGGIGTTTGTTRATGVAAARAVTYIEVLHPQITQILLINLCNLWIRGAETRALPRLGHS